MDYYTIPDFGGMNQQRSNFAPLGNNNASPKMSAQVRQTLALQRQQHLRQRLVQQQMAKNRASQMIRQQQQQQQGFSGSGFGQFGQQGMDQQSQSPIPENFTELLNSGVAPNVSLPVQRTPGIPSHTNSLSPGDNFMNVMGSQGMMGQGQGRMSPQISPQYNQSQNQWNVHHSPGGGMQNAMMQQPRGNQYGGIPQRQMTSHSQSMGGQMSGVMTSHSQSMGGQMSGVMTSQTMGSGQQNHFQFPQPDSQFNSPGGNPQMNMYGQQPQQQNMMQNRMMQRQMNMPVRAQSPRGQLSPYGSNTGQPQDTVMMSPNMSQLSPSSQLASSGMYAQTSPLSTSSLQGSFDQDMGLYSNAMDMNVSTSSAPNATSQFVRQEVRAMCSARLQNQQQQQLPPPQQQQQVLQNQQQQQQMTFDTGEIPMDLIDQITELEAISQQQQQQSQQQQQPQQTHHPHHPKQSPGGSSGGTQYDSNGQPIREEVVVSQTRQEARQRYQQFRQLSSGVVTAVPVVEEDPESTATNVFRNQLRTPAQIAAANQNSRQRVPSVRDMPQVNVVQTEPRAPVEDLRPANQRNSLLQQLLSDP